MKLYHGSLVVVEAPEILPRENGRTADFGTGFYTITNYEQAERWVKILMFHSPSEQWLDFVIENRRNKNFVHDYDIVFGPVANDRVYTTIILYEDES